MEHELPPSTSASQLTTYVLCPRKFAFVYVYGVEPQFRSLALVTGSAIHSAIGWWFETKLAGKAPTIDAAKEILAADLLAGTIGGPTIRWKDSTPESLEADAARYLTTYLTRFGDLPVAAVEQSFRVDLADPETGEVVGRPLKGFFDLVLKDHRVVEVKTSSRGWSAFDLIRHLQIGAYAFAWNTLHGGPSQIDVHVIVKLKREPRVESYPIERGEPATRWWITAAGAIERAIEGGHFPPKPSALCHECEFESACAAWVDEQPAFDRQPVRRLPIARDEQFVSADL